MSMVDERVVEMKFDNENFEKNVRTSMQTLNEFKKNLNLQSSASGISKSIGLISGRFTTMGLVGMAAIQNITNSIIGLSKQIVSYLNAPLNQIVHGGISRAMNIEQAKFQLKGLGIIWDQQLDQINDGITLTEAHMTEAEKLAGKVTDSIADDIDYGVKDTAYGLDAAAKAASQLAASQVQIGDEMRVALRGISGVAAMTNSEYEDISRVFTTVAGNGRLMGEQLLSISSRGLNAAASIANYLREVQGITDATESSVREMVSKGAIDFYTFASAMDWAFGEHAKDANETFTGALSNVKAALSRIGAEFATPAINDLRDVLNGIRPVINNFKAAIVPIAKIFGKITHALSGSLVGAFGQLEEKLKGITFAIPSFMKALMPGKESVVMSDWIKLSTRIGDSAGALQNALIETAKEHGVAIDEMMKSEGSFAKTLSSGWLSLDILTDALKTLSVESSEASTRVVEDISSIESLARSVIFGEYGNGQNRADLLRSLGYDYDLIQDYANKVYDLGKVTEFLGGESLATAGEIQNLSEEQLVSIGYTEDQAKALKDLADSAEDATTPLGSLIASLNKPSGIELIVDSATNLIKYLVSGIKQVKAAWEEVFGSTLANDIYNTIAEFKGFTDELKLQRNESSNINTTFINIFESIKDIGKIAKKVIKGIWRLFSPIAKAFNAMLPSITDTFHTLTSSLSDATGYFRMTEEQSNRLMRTVEGALAVIDMAFQILVAFIQTILPILIPSLGKVADGALAVGSSFADWAINADKAMKEGDGLKKVMEKIGKVIAWTKEKIGLGIDALKRLKDSISEKFEEHGIFSIGDAFNYVKDEVVAFFKSIKENGILKTLSDTFAPLTDKISEFATNIEESGGVVEKFKAILEPLTTTINNFTAASDSMSGIWQKVKEFGKSLLQPIDDILDALGSDNLLDINTGIERIKSIWAAWKGLVASVDNSENSTMIWVATIGGIVLIIKAIRYLIRTAKGLPTVPNLITSVIGTFNSITGFFSAAKKKLTGGTKFQQIAKTIRNLATSIFMISLSFLMIASIKDESAFKRAAITVGAITGVMLAMAMLFTTPKLWFEAPKGVGRTFIAFALTLLVLVRTFEHFKNFKPEQIETALEAFRHIIVAYVLLMAAMSLVGPQDHKLNIAGIGLSIFSIARAITYLGKQKPEVIEQGTKLVEAIGIWLATFLGISLFAGTAGMKMISGVNQILAIAGAIMMLALTVVGLGLIPFPIVLLGIGYVAIMLTMLTAVVKVLSSPVQKSVPGNIKQLLAITLAIAVLAPILYALGKIPWEQMEVGMAGMITIFSGLTFILLILSKMTGKAETIKKLTTSLLKISATISIVAGVIIAMAVINNYYNLWDSIIMFGAIVALLLVTVTALYQFTNKTKNLGKIIDSLFKLSLVFSILSGIVIAMGLVGLDTVRNGLLGLSAIALILVGVIIAITAINKKASEIDSIVDSLMKLMIVIGILAGIALLLGVIGFDTILPGLLSLGAIVVTLLATTLVLSKASVGLDSVARTLLSFSLAIGVLTAAIIILGKLNPEQLAQGLAALLGVIVAFLAIALISKLTGATLAIDGLALGLLMVSGAMLMASAAIYIFMAAVKLADEGAVQSAKNIVNAIVGGIKSLGTLLKRFFVWIFEKIKEFVLAVPGILKKFFTETLPDILNGFLSKLAEIVAIAIITIVEGLVKGIPIIGEKIASGLEIVKEGIEKFFNRDTGLLEGANYAEGLVDGYNNVVDNANWHATPLHEDNSAWQTHGPVNTGASWHATPMDEGSVEESGSILGGLFGDSFSGSALTGITDAFSGFDISGVKDSLFGGFGDFDVTDIFGDFDTSALTGDFTSGFDLSSLYSGNGFDYSSFLGDSDLYSQLGYDNGESYVTSFNKAVDENGNVTGIEQYLNDELVAAFSKDSENFNVAEQIAAGMKFEVFEENGELAVRSFVDGEYGAIEHTRWDSPDSPGYALALKAAGGTSAYKAFYENGELCVTEYVNGIELATYKAGDAGYDLAVEAADGLGYKSVSGWYNAAGELVIDEYVDGIKTNAYKVGDEGYEIREKMLNGFSYVRGFNEAGEEVVYEIVNGVAREAYKAGDEGYELALKVAENANSRTALEKAEEAGINLVAGFVKGLKNKLQNRNAADAADDVANGVLDRFKITWQEKSPSKATEKMGWYLVAGLANGLKDNVSVATGAASTVAKSALDSISNAIAVASDYVNGMDAQPTIRPVLDLSEIQNGTSKISSMFGQQSIGLASANAFGFSRHQTEPTGTTTINNYNSNSFDTRVDGSESPEDWASRFARRIRTEMRMA